MLRQLLTTMPCGCPTNCFAKVQGNVAKTGFVLTARFETLKSQSIPSLIIQTSTQSALDQHSSSDASTASQTAAQHRKGVTLVDGVAETEQQHSTKDSSVRNALLETEEPAFVDKGSVKGKIVQVWKRLFKPTHAQLCML